MNKQDVRLIWLFTRLVGISLFEPPAGPKITPVQFMALRFIKLHEAPTLGAVAEALAVSNAAATKLVDRLVQKGLVSRTEGRVDRRERVLALTERGLELCGAAARSSADHLEKTIAKLSAEDRAALRRGLKAFLVAGLDDPGLVHRICLRCGDEHESDCPGDEVYRALGGEERDV